MISHTLSLLTQYHNFSFDNIFIHNLLMMCSQHKWSFSICITNMCIFCSCIYICHKWLMSLQAVILNWCVFRVKNLWKVPIVTVSCRKAEAEVTDTSTSSARPEREYSLQAGLLPFSHSACGCVLAPKAVSTKGCIVQNGVTLSLSYI